MNTQMRDSEQDDRSERFSQTVRKLAHLKLSPLQAEILRELMDGNRTMAELTLYIFHSDYKDQHYETYHSRTRRAVKNLENAGFVSKKKLFGRDKPYGLTMHGAARIASIIPDMPKPAIFMKKDHLLFLCTACMGVAAWLTFNLIVTHLFSIFLGMTAIRSLQIFRRVT